MKYLTKLTIGCILAALTLTACITDRATSPIGVPVEEQVFIMEEDLKEDVHIYPQLNPVTGTPDAVLLDVSEVEGVMGQFIAGYFGEAVETIVLTEAAYVKEDTLKSEIFRPLPQKVDEVTGEAGIDTIASTEQLVTGLGALIPGVAPYTPIALYLLGLLGKRRPRQHLGNFAKAIIPHDGKIDIGGALMYAQKAIGFEHSTEDPDELAALASKKKAIKEAKEA